MNPYSLSIYCFGFCSLLIGFFVWMKRGDLTGKIYFLFSASIGFWALFSGICWTFNDTSAQALFYLRIADIFALFIPPTWLHFCLVYAENPKKHRALLRTCYALSGLFVLFSFSDLYILRLRMTSLGIVYKEPGIIFEIYTVLFFVAVLTGYYFLIRKMFQSHGRERAQAFGFIAAISVGYIGGGLYFLPIYHIEIPQYAIFLMPFYPFVAAYFMTKRGLFDVEELAQAAHRDKLTAIGVLAASINHEVKNPLFIIKGLAESCLERQKEGIFPSDKKALESANDAMKRSMEQADRAMDIIKRLSLFAKAKEIAEKTIAQSDRVLGIIKSFSSYAKRETDKVYEKRRVRIKEIVERILPFVESELSLKKIAILQNIPEDLEVLADTQSLEEIFINLIVNACQAISEAGKPGEIEITAKTPSPSLSRGERDGVRGADQVLITIRDTGPGLAQEQLSRIFEPFYTTKASGTGLGLYVVKQLVEKNGGRIDVSSKVGFGTTFTLIFHTPGV